MPLGGIGSPGGEGSRGSPGTATHLASDQPDPSQYHNTAKGTIIPHRINDNGRSPGFDPMAGLGQFKVVDVDTTPNAMSAVEHAPGALDRFGNPVEKETPCPTTNPTSETSASQPSQMADSGSPSDQAQPPLKTVPGPATQPSRSTRRTQAQRLDELSTKVDALVRVCQTSAPTPHTPDDSLHQRLQSLEDKLDSLTSSLVHPATAKTASTSGNSLLPADTWTVELHGSFGRVKMEAVTVDFRSESTVLILLDPDKPHMVPARSEGLLDVVLAQGEDVYTFKARPNGWSSPLMLGDTDLLLMIMSMVDDDDQS